MPPNPSVTTKHDWKNHKTTPRQPLGVQEGLKRLFTSLCAQIDGGHFSNALKTCDKSAVFISLKCSYGTCLKFWNLVLRLDPKDADARQTKVFLLLQTEQYRAALSLIDSDDDHAHHAYERAYLLYRLSRESEARDVLKSIKGDQNAEDSRGLVHLEAQLACRSLLDASQMLMFPYIRLIAKDHMMSQLICTTNCSIPPNLWVTISLVYSYTHRLQGLRRTLRYSHQPSSISKPSGFYQYRLSPCFGLASNVYYFYSGDSSTTTTAALGGCTVRLGSHTSEHVYKPKLQTSTQESTYVACTCRCHPRCHPRPRSGAMVEEERTFDIWPREKKKGAFWRWRGNTRKCICW